MSRMMLPIVLVSGVVFSIAAHGQVAPAQSVAPAPTAALADNPAPAENSPGSPVDPASLLPDLPPLSPAKSTLVGGTLERLDRVQDRLTIRVFGGGKMKIMFDPRTRIFRDGEPASASDLRQGDRVYIDTILDGTSILALNIRMKRSAAAGESQGVVLSYRADSGELTMRDMISPQAIKVRLNPSTRITQGDRSVPASKIAPGTLVNVKLGAQKDSHDLAREISILAVPGDSFTFVGQVTSLDLRLGLLVLTSSTDRKTYEIHFDSGVTVDDKLQPGVDVTVQTRFEGNRYVARSLTVNSISDR